MRTDLPPALEVPSHGLIGWGAALGIGAGLIEAAVATIQSGRTALLIGRVGDFVWMAPLVGLLLGLTSAIFLTMARRLAPRLFTPRVILTIVGTVVLLSPIFLFQRMHRLAALLLALGIGFQSAAWLTRRRSRIGLVRWMLPLVLVCWVVGGLGLEAVRTLRERNAIRRLPPAEANRPNVLLLVLDTVRAMSLNLYGYPRATTPELKKWAERGARFDYAVAPAPWTLPSHGSIFSGRLPREFSATFRTPFDERYPVLAEALAGHGYVTGGLVANIWYCAAGHGLERGFLQYRDYPRTAWRVIDASALGRWLFEQATVRRFVGWYEMLWRKNAGLAVDEFLQWEGKPRDGRPFFAFINFFDAHNPFVPPTPFDTMFASRPGRHYNPRFKMPDFPDLTADEIEFTRDQYEGAIGYIDHSIGRMLTELDRRGVLKNTIVVITSDHGEQFGEHELLGHGNSLYSQVLHVPLVIVYPPKVPAGSVVASPVGLRDIPTTVLDLAGLPNDRGLQGRSLTRFWERPSDAGDVDEVIVSEMPGASAANAVSLIADGHHYVRWWKRPEGIYDLRTDPTEQANLVGTPMGDSLLTRFRDIAAQLSKKFPGLKKGEANDTL
ncbi:MAG TPA: sulfatase [Gemmatimonadales bacterium]|nr:sulfatase [Gemmatimonadales bacterium]